MSPFSPRRCEMVAEPLYSVEPDEDADLAGWPAADGLFVVLGRAKSRRLVPLAYSVPDHMPPVVVDGLSVTWSVPAAAAFSSMRRDARVHDPSFARNLPYASLRGMLEVALDNVARIATGLGLSGYALKPGQT